MSKARKILLTASAGLLLVGLLLWSFWPATRTLANVLQEAGYFELVPPSTFHGPGTINTVEALSNGKVRLHPTCEIDNAFLNLTTLESKTVDRSFMQSLSKSFDVSSKIKEYLSQSGAADQTSSVTITFQNVSILLMTDEALIKVQQQVIKEACQEVIIWNLNAGSIVCQTQAVLKADVRYVIGFQDNMLVGERTKLTRDLAAEFKIKVHQNGQDQIVGEGLFFGVKLAPRGIIRNIPRTNTIDCKAELAKL